ncbi:HEPN domain-containing protein [Pseudomonas ogarae]|uniref:HEPN domain-containing protein n=1 Tax=Pseudomonas ogarae (strain DSM 112162 / CECT 30235 / F113) TaxID=1114970 RepID=UPI001115E38C|nr:HEPN domain-containing protein [Pseudomonas ogarae]
MQIACSTKHVDTFKANISDVIRLIQIHRDLSGSERGRRVGMECLNKSAIVLILASWEAFVEDLAESAFDCMLENAGAHTAFPAHVLNLAWADFKKTNTNDAFSSIATGWKDILKSHRATILDKHIVRGGFNTPSADNCNNIFAQLIGLTSFSSCWNWKITRTNMTRADAESELSSLINLRGEVAHRTATAKAVQKTVVLKFAKLITRLAVRSHNSVRDYLTLNLGFEPCREISTAEETVLIDNIDPVKVV